MTAFIGCVNDPEPYIIRETKISVRDLSEWNPENPNGVPSNDATVSLYRSQEDFTNNTPFVQVKTNTSGVAIFKSLSEGNYFLEVTKGDKSNLFQKSTEPVNGYYMGLKPIGVFRSQEEINSTLAQADAGLGDFRFSDQNADGVINEEDKVPLPIDQLSTDQRELTVYIGYSSGQKIQYLSPNKNFLKIGHKAFNLQYGKITFTRNLNPGYALTLTLGSEESNLTSESPLFPTENRANNLNGAKILLNFRFYSADFSGIPSGIYPNKDPKITVPILGTWDTTDYFEYWHSDEGSIQYTDDGFLRLGKITVNRLGDEYEISLQCTNNSGTSVTGHYKGKVTYSNADQPNVD
ncbi:hypothetical protein GCM10028791_32700 [Echinicola sediminis]